MSLSQLAFQSSGSVPNSTAATEPPHHFSCDRRAESGGSIRLFLAGELDLAASNYFRAALDAGQDDSTRVLLDLRSLALIDCAGLSIVFAAAERSRHQGAVLIFLAPRGQVRRMLDLVGAPAGVTVLDDGDLPDTGTRVAA